MQYYRWTDNTYFVGINSDATVVTVVPWKATGWRQIDTVHATQKRTDALASAMQTRAC